MKADHGDAKRYLSDELIEERREEAAREAYTDEEILALWRAGKLATREERKDPPNEGSTATA